MEFGKKLVKVRKEKNLSQKDLEKKSEIKREYISKIENGKLPNPSLQTIRKIAKAFDMSFSEFFEGVD